MIIKTKSCLCVNVIVCVFVCITQAMIVEKAALVE